MRLTQIHSLEACLELATGLHIGAGDSEMHIGGTDNPVVKHPLTQEPYIPGSSLKGKIRSLLEWRAGVVGHTGGKVLSFEHLKRLNNPAQRQQAQAILQLFGISGGDKMDEQERQIREQLGPTRLAFWDCSLNADWLTQVRDNNQLLVESKSENFINRIAGTAEHPRNTERVPAGAQFHFRLSIKQLEGDNDDLLNTLLAGLKLLELDSLGGSGSRGYGKVKFTQLKLAHFPDIQTRFDALDPFA